MNPLVPVVFAHDLQPDNAIQCNQISKGQPHDIIREEHPMEFLLMTLDKRWIDTAAGCKFPLKFLLQTALPVIASLNGPGVL